MSYWLSTTGNALAEDEEAAIPSMITDGCHASTLSGPSDPAELDIRKTSDPTSAGLIMQRNKVHHGYTVELPRTPGNGPRLRTERGSVAKRDCESALEFASVCLWDFNDLR